MTSTTITLIIPIITFELYTLGEFPWNIFRALLSCSLHLSSSHPRFQLPTIFKIVNRFHLTVNLFLVSPSLSNNFSRISTFSAFQTKAGIYKLSQSYAQINCGRAQNCFLRISNRKVSCQVVHRAMIPIPSLNTNKSRSVRVLTAQTLS